MNNRKRLIFFLSILAISIISGMYIKHRRQSLLEGETATTYAIYDRTVVFTNTGPVSHFRFKVGYTVIESDHIGRFKGLSKGDSVLIKYSVEDPNVFEVVDSEFNKRDN